jgi:hypothetical protein
LPSIYYALTLRASGALYYGSLDGFWNVTGKTLARYIIFHDSNWLKYASLAVIFLLLFYFIRRWKKRGNLKFFTESSTILAWFLVGNCIAIVLMAKLLGINYPEDRVGMHLAILFLLLIGFVLNQIKNMNWLLVVMLFFPITMIPRINLTTSIFSPDNRMPKSFFQDVHQKVNPYSTISVYPMQRLTWSYLSRDLDSSNFVISQRKFNHTSDIVLYKTTLLKDKEYLKNYDVIDQYDVIAQDKESTFIAYKRKSPYQKEVIYSSPIEIIDAQDEFITIYKSDIPDSLRNRKLQFHVHADVVAENIYREFAVIAYSTFDKEENSIDYRAMNERWIHGTEKEFVLNFNYAVDHLKPEENEIRLYIWNQKKEKISLKNGIFQIIELTDPTSNQN